MGTKAFCNAIPISSHHMPLDHWWSLEEVCWEPEWSKQLGRVWGCCSHVPLPRLLLYRLDATFAIVSIWDHELFDPRQRVGNVVRPSQCVCVSILYHAYGPYANSCDSIVFVYIMPIGLANIGWKMYFVNSSWDVVILGLIVSRFSLASRCVSKLIFLGILLGRDKGQDPRRSRWAVRWAEALGHTWRRASAQGREDHWRGSCGGEA